MGKINWNRVILGGLVAGAIINIFEFVLNGVVLARDMEAAMTARRRPATKHTNGRREAVCRSGANPHCDGSRHAVALGEFTIDEAWTRSAGRECPRATSHHP